ncbi:DUF4179 domain-containing protein [Bacillus timonensis]|uniref:DUF4179 domain-containing protein n=1 Tax=Bacillus timonensis TaxID=1033734 RepID=UPI0002899E1A|nr:DUF4179 domain-containing protein [Bacillus timonensis]
MAETDPILIKMIRERDMDAIINWFDVRKASFYKLSWSYIKNLEEIQDVFYNCIIKVHTEIRKQKKNPFFESWVMSLFIQECKKMGSQGVEREEFDDVLILTYVLGLSHDEVAEVLTIPVKTVKDRLHKGIRHLSGVDGAHYHEKFIDYVSRTLERPEKIELEIHLHACQICQNSLVAFQDTIHSLIDEAETIKVPTNFLEEVIKKVKKVEDGKRKKQKKRTTIGIAVSSSLFLLLLIGYVTNGFHYMYYSWLDWRDKEDAQLLAYLKSGLGEPLNLVQESNGIKVTIKSVIADDFQTLIYYEVENRKGDEQYGINFWNGVTVEDEMKTFDQQAISLNQPPVQPLESKGKIFKGTISLLPVLPDTKNIKVNLTKLQKMEQEAENSRWAEFYGDEAFVTGEWNFEIPVKKKASIEHEIEKKMTVDGMPIKFEKLIIAPTITILQYQFEQFVSDKNINELLFEGIKVKEKTAEPALFGWNIPINGGYGQWISFQSAFDSLYFEDPKEVSIQFGSISYYKNEFYKVDIDMNQPFPQSFDYLGNNISIDKIELGMPTKIELTTEMTENRQFESIMFDIVGENDETPVSMGIHDVEGVLVDRSGKMYKEDEYNYYTNMNQLERPRYYQTKIGIEVHSEITEEEIIPGWLQINGYQGTTYLDDEIDIKLQ